MKSILKFNFYNKNDKNCLFIKTLFEILVGKFKGSIKSKNSLTTPGFYSTKIDNIAFFFICP